MFFNGYVILQHLWLELSALVMFIFVLNRSKLFRHTILNNDASLVGKLLLAVVFGLLGIFGTYWGIPVVDGKPDIYAYGHFFNKDWDAMHVDGIANTRAVGVIVGGLIGGPLVGAGAGLIAGVHRFSSFVTFSSPLSGGITLMEGIIAGLIHKKIKNKREQWRYGLAVGLILEALHMWLLFVLGDPIDRTVRLVYAVTPAMLITNSIGVAVFIGILEAGFREKEKIEALAAKTALTIASKTMTFLRAGLDEKSATEVANIIYQTVDHLGAVALTSRERVLAFVGSTENKACNPTITRFISQVLETGEYGVMQKKSAINGEEDACHLFTQVVVPLKVDRQVIGTLVLYKINENSISLFDTELACGLAELISTQIQISKGERQAKLLVNAEVKMLQAQINPHFLFNALNTIGYYCRKQPETAKRLIVHLGNYYRNNLAGNDTVVPLSKEIQCIDDYIKIEMARFEDKITVDYQIDQECEIEVPPLILQPLVENAIKHGISPKDEGGHIRIIGKQKDGGVELAVEDDGIGMTPEIVSNLLEYDSNRKSIGLSNVHRRLISIYGPDNGLHIESKKNVGTRVSLIIPQRKENTNAPKSTHCG